MNQINMPRDKWSWAFQLRLGLDEWLQPFADDEQNAWQNRVLNIWPCAVRLLYRTAWKLWKKLAKKVKRSF